ncbi:Uncharacterised protein [Klebsiella pneumoniae subsp. rhinoscleromatis]|nr:Uncharacterised protein [Klebsiella pneumoniae subsp. rhinoscleromatis]
MVTPIRGAREDLAIWKRRALEAEESVRRLEQINDHLVKEAQGESRMGEPVIAQPAPVVPEEATPDSIEILAQRQGVVTTLYSSGMKTSEMRPLIPGTPSAPPCCRN